jgi:hypothetical protein
MRWSELEGDTWTIPAARYKTKIDFELPLSRAALDVLATVPRYGEKGFVFTTTGEAGIGGFSKFKAHFDGLAAHRRASTTEHAAAKIGSDG